MKKFFRNLLKKNTLEKVKYYELKAYERGYVHCRRYYGDDPQEAAYRFMRKHNAKVASIEACNYYSNVIDEVLVNA